MADLLRCDGCTTMKNISPMCERCKQKGLKDAKRDELAEIISEAESRRAVINGSFFYWLKARLRRMEREHG